MRFFLAVIALLALRAPVRAEDGLGLQREISDMIPLHHNAPEDKHDKKWAVLPEAGYSPDQQFNGGVKFTGRQLTSQELTLDTELNAAMGRQKGADVTLLAPKLLDGRAIGIVEYHYYLSPAKPFFGLGDNHARSPLSYHSIERQRALAAFAYHMTDDFVVAAAGGWRQTKIERSGSSSASPSTLDAFPDLAGSGVSGTSPLALSLVYNDRTSITRPTKGWTVIGASEWVPRGLDNDFAFGRYTLDASYLHPLGSPTYIIGARAQGEVVEGKSGNIPFFELGSLGGADDMRGFFPDRFLGRQKMLFSAEFRAKVADFQFRDLWRVKIDGVVFGDMGRVFLAQSEISGSFREKSTLPQLFNEQRFDEGVGVRIALGEAILARIDVGWSNEDNALVYLVFGQTF